ncbi:hypothetical protein ACT7DA_13810 [Bacillus pacificus]
MFNEIGENFGVQLALKRPEEYELYAQITSETNVYVLAGIAFSLSVEKMIKSYENGRAHKNYIIYVKSAA